jgi:hypothetical protein
MPGWGLIGHLSALPGWDLLALSLQNICTVFSNESNISKCNDFWSLLEFCIKRVKEKKLNKIWNSDRRVGVLHASIGIFPNRMVFDDRFSVMPC